MLFQDLIELKKITNIGTLKLKDINGKEIEENFKYNPPAKKGDFEKLEEEKINIPNEYKKLLEFSNGFELYNFQGLDGFKIYGTSEIPKINSLIKKSYGDEWDNNVIIGIECIGDGTYLGFKEVDSNSAEVIDCFLETFPFDWQPISLSISEFFSNLIKSEGNKFWLK